MECSPTITMKAKWFLGLSQSPSIMECSPTACAEAREEKSIVAVPVNYGMLSYTR